MCRGDAIELLAFRPSAWQARLDKHGEAGLGMAVLHCPSPNASDRSWTNRERDAADTLLLIATTAGSSSCKLTSSGNGSESAPLVSDLLVEVR